MSLLLLDKLVAQSRRGVPRLESHAIVDDDGHHNYLGITYFYMLYAYEFERERYERNADWLASKKFDYVRALGEVDWPDRPILPGRPSYETVLAGAIDGLAARGIRTQLTLVGGVQPDYRLLAEKVINVCSSRADKILYFEGANEADSHNKLNETQLLDLNERLLSRLPNLTALSRVPPGLGQLDRWALLSDAAGAKVLPFHDERNEGDRHWRQVRQAYDHRIAKGTASDQEGPGTDSSLGVLEDPRQQALKRALHHMARGGCYTLHCAAGVSGVAVPHLGRPAEFWETENIDAIVDALHAVEPHLPSAVENWKVVNNARNDHPLPLPSDAFWAGTSAGVCNRNYAALSPDGVHFLETLLGVNGFGLIEVGRALRDMQLMAHDPLGASYGPFTLEAGDWLMLPGSVDRMAGYLIVGEYL